MQVVRGLGVVFFITSSLSGGCSDQRSANQSAPAPDVPLPPAGPDDGADDSAEELPPVGDYSAYFEQPTLIDGPLDLQSRVSEDTPGVITAVDRRRATPTFFVAGRGDGAARQLLSGIDAESAAHHWLDQHRDVYGLSRDAASTAMVEHVTDTGRGGRVVQLRQRIDGIEVHGIRMSLMLDSSGQLVAISGNLHGAADVTEVGDPMIAPESALALALDDLTHAPHPLVTVATDPERHSTRFEIDESWLSFAQPAFVQRVFYPLSKELVPAYRVELEVGYAQSTLSRAYAYVISAEDGRVLERRNLTFADAYAYKVWADPDPPYAPFDGPHADVTPHPTGHADDNRLDLAFVPRNTLAIDGLNTNPDGRADPWLAPGSVSTSGNNIDAYADREAPNGFSDGDLRASISQNETFFWSVDGSLSPTATDEQVMSSVTQIFYTLNWLHDYYYDSGFTETAGNAQELNYGRGGVEGDALLAEAQDRGGKNNANMSTPSDGLNPRMQMYLWDGRVDPIGETTFEVLSPPALAGSFDVRGSRFGIDDIVSASGPLILAIDEGGEDGIPEDGCEALTTDVSGKIAVVDRGQCTFVQKAQNAQAAGASALIIVNQDPDAPDALPPLGGDDDEITIPVLGLSYAVGQILEATLETTVVEVEMTRAGRVRGVDRDGTIDNSIVAHEWGHYFHHRNSECSGTRQCGAMSEGWGDFVALHLHLRAGDPADGVYAKAAFSTGDSYFGIRRVPYSTDFDKNALTFRHIGDGEPLPDHHPLAFTGQNSEVHNAGELWATMLHEAYIALIEDSVDQQRRLSFDDAKRRMADYITAGLQLSPVNATILEVRDSILAAAAANDRRDLEVLAAAFARRGAGTGAVGPTRESDSLQGVVESYEVSGALEVIAIDITADEDCDRDGHVDAAERGAIVLHLMNSGPLSLGATTVSLRSNRDDLIATSEDVIVPQLAPYQVVTVRLPFELQASTDAPQTVTFEADAHNDEAISDRITEQLTARLNIDDVIDSSNRDDVESSRRAWVTRSSQALSTRWERVSELVEGELDSYYHADDISSAGEQLLTSPLLLVGEEPFVVQFDHRYRFEASEQDGEARYWDGGVIEISTDHADTWTDVSERVEVAYGGVLRNDSGNPLSDRRAFVGESAGWPAWTRVELDFGDTLAGEEVLIRFRLGTDRAIGGHGWDLDDFVFSGIVNTPFATVEEHRGVCDSSSPGLVPPGDSGGCTCRASTPAGASWFVIAMLGIALGRRRRTRRANRSSL